MNRSHKLICIVVALAIFTTFATLKAEELILKNGDTIAFMGDSITRQGWESDSGYVKKVVEGLKVNGIKIKPYPAGISGHKSNDMLARLEKDVISKKPTWMTLSCGVNDIAQGARGVKLEDYKKNISKIIDICQKNGIKVIILTATVVHGNPKSAINQKLDKYNDFLRKLAAEKNLILADLNADMQQELRKRNPEGKRKGHILTYDGIHMNPLGNTMMAIGVLRTFGLSDKQLAKARESWKDNTGGLRLTVQITDEDFEKIEEMSAKKNSSGINLASEIARKALISK